MGGLSTELSDDDIKNYFAQYGTIVDVEMPYDKSKNQRKGFCFITFESEQVVTELLKTPKQTINGKEVFILYSQLIPYKYISNWASVMYLSYKICLAHITSLIIPR